MNRLMKEQYPLFRLYQDLRRQLLGLLDNHDLAFTPGGANLALGVLCREIGEVEQAYVDSFRTLAQTFDYRHPDPAISGDLAALAAWYRELDAALEAVLAAYTDDMLAIALIDRGHNFKVPIHVQLSIYQEALLIFYGKASVYLKLMGKTLPEQWQHWIA